jgi:hypothetical protein
VKLNLLGRVRNTRLSHSNSLLPLFEAVINSIHAIEEVGPAALGEIKVVIERAKTQQMKIDGTAPLEPINSFRITDNGSGFTDANYESFCTSDSQLYPLFLNSGPVHGPVEAENECDSCVRPIPPFADSHNVFC